MNYPTDWQKKEQVIGYEQNSRNVIFTSPFEDELLDDPSWHETDFTMALAIDSAQHAGVTDYRVLLSRNLVNSHHYNNSSNNALDSMWEWTKNVTEVPAYDNSRVLGLDKNYTGFYDKGKPYILFSFDLQKINFPQQYRAVFYITDYFVIKHRLSRLIDTTNWVIIPPPEFTMSTSPGSVVLRPGKKRMFN